MSDINGGPAFPRIKGLGDLYITEGGMHLRDYFAAKAMHALVIEGASRESGIGTVALLAYQMADFMLEQRNNREKNA
jgi:hypothetical protein